MRPTLSGGSPSAFRPVVRVEPYLWEDEPLQADDTFQAQIIDPADVEIVVCILWARLGSALPDEPRFRRRDETRYESGTQYEIERVLERGKTARAPIFSSIERTRSPTSPRPIRRKPARSLTRRIGSMRLSSGAFGTPTEHSGGPFSNSATPACLRRTWKNTCGSASRSD